MDKGGYRTPPSPFGRPAAGRAHFLVAPMIYPASLFELKTGPPLPYCCDDDDHLADDTVTKERGRNPQRQPHRDTPLTAPTIPSCSSFPSLRVRTGHLR